MGYWNLLKASLRLHNESVSSLSGGPDMGLHSSEEGDGSGEGLDSRMRQVKELYDKFGSDDDRTSSQLQVEVNMCLFESMKAFVAGFYDGNQDRLEALRKSVLHFASRSAVRHLLFSISRVRAVGYYLEAKLDLCVKHLNTCVSECPKWNGNHAIGLADVLMLMSEVYYSLGYNDEAFHSAKLCVDVALSRLENFEKQSATEPSTGGVASRLLGASKESANFNRSVGPALDEYTAMTAAYQTLGRQLHAQGNFALAVEWLDRALSTAAKFGLDYHYRAELQTQLDDSNAAMASDLRDNMNETSTPAPTPEDQGVAEEKRERRSTSRPLSAMPHKTSSSSTAQLDHNHRDSSGVVDDHLDFENASGDGSRHYSGDPDLRNSDKNSGKDGGGGPVHANLPSVEGQEASRNRPKSAISKLGGGYGPDSVRMKPSHIPGASDDVGAGVIAGGWGDVSREIQRHSRPTSRDGGTTGGVVAMLAPATGVGRLKRTRPNDKKTSIARRQNGGNVTGAPGRNEDMPSFGDTDVALMHDSLDDDGVRDHELDMLAKLGGVAFSPAVQTVHRHSQQHHYQQEEQQLPLFVDGLQSSAGYTSMHPSQAPGSPSLQTAITFGFDGVSVGGNKSMQHVDSLGEVYNASHTQEHTTYNAPVFGHGMGQHHSGNISSPAAELQRQHYGYSGADILDGRVNVGGLEELGKDGASGPQEVFDLHAYRQSMPHVVTLADEDPPRKDTRSVWERTVGATSHVQREIHLAKKTKDAERRRKKWQKMNERAERIRREERRIAKERFKLSAAKQRGLEAIELERRKQLEVSAQQQKVVNAALEERMAAEKRAKAASNRLIKEREQAKKDIEEKNRALQAEKMRMEAEIAEKLVSEVNSLRKAEAQREAVFQRQQQDLMAALNAADATPEKTDTGTTAATPKADAGIEIGTNAASGATTGMKVVADNASRDALGVECAVSSPDASRTGEVQTASGPSAEGDETAKWDEGALAGMTTDTGGEESGVDADVTRSELRMTSKNLRENVDRQAVMGSIRKGRSAKGSPLHSSSKKTMSAKDLMKEVTERKRESKKRQRKEKVAVAPLPAGSEPTASATQIRASLMEEMNSYMKNVKQAALDRAPNLEMVKQDLYRRSAVCIQRVVRGALSRNDKPLRRALARAHKLRLRERALTEKEAAIAAQEREVERSKKASDELLQSVIDFQRIEMTIDKHRNTSAAPLAVSSSGTSAFTAVQGVSQGQSLPCGDQPSNNRTELIESMLNDDISAIQDADDDGSLRLDAYSRQSESSSVSLARSEAAKVSNHVISMATKDLTSPEKLSLVDGSAHANGESKSANPNESKSGGAESALVASEKDVAGFRTHIDTQLSASAEPKSTTPSEEVESEPQASESARMRIKLKPAVIEPEHVSSSGKSAGFASIKNVLSSLFRSKKSDDAGAPASASTSADRTLDPPVGTMTNKMTVVGTASVPPLDGNREGDAFTLPMKSESEPYQPPRPVSTVTVTEHTSGALNVAMTLSGPVAVDTAQWDALVATAAEYQPDHRGLEDLIKAQTEGERLLEESREQKKVTSTGSPPSLSSKPTNSYIDDSEVAYAYLNLIEVHLGQSDIWKKQGCTIPAILHRDRAVRLHLRVQREYPNERLIPTTGHIKRTMFSTSLMVRKPAHRLVEGLRQMHSLSRIDPNADDDELREDEAQYAGHDDTAMGPIPFPVEYSIGIYNSLMNYANEENLHWLVEAYYREAMELKYGIPCYLARSDIELAVSTKRVSTGVMSTYIEDLATLSADVRARTSALNIEIEAVRVALYDKIHAPAAGDTADAAHHEAIRMNRLCESLAQEYLAAGALLAAIAARERGYRSCLSPAPEFSVRVLGSLGVLSRIAGAKMAADKYFVEMQTVGKHLSDVRHSLDGGSEAGGASGAVDGAMLDLAYYTAHQADLYRTNGFYKKAIKLLDVACKDLENFYGSEYEHPISAASKCSYHLSLVGSMTPLESYFDVKAAIPPYCGTLDIEKGSIAGGGLIDPWKESGFGGKLPGVMSFRTLYLPHSEEVMYPVLYPLKPKEKLSLQDESFSMLDAQGKRDVLSHALYALNTDPTKILTEGKSDRNSGRVDNSHAYKTNMIDQLLTELNRASASPSPYALNARELREQKLWELQELEKTRQHELYGDYLKNHVLSDYIIQVNSHMDSRTAAQQRIFDIDLLRTKVCHLVDPLCVAAVSVMKPDEFDATMVHHYGDAVDPPRAQSSPKAAFLVPMASGQRPFGTDWPEYTEGVDATLDATGRFFDVESDHDDGKSVISDLNPFVNARAPPFLSARSQEMPTLSGSAEDASAADGSTSQVNLGIMKVLTTPVFRLNPKSLINDHKERPMFDFDLTGIHSRDLVFEKHQLGLMTKGSSGFQKALSFMDKDTWKYLEREDFSHATDQPKKTKEGSNAQSQIDTSFEVCITADGWDWRLNLPEKCVTRMASAGEWVKFRLLPSVNAKVAPLHVNEVSSVTFHEQGTVRDPHSSIWLRTSVVMIGALLEQFSRLWSIHSDWASHHIINAAALEEIIITTILDGIHVTKRAPGGGKQLVEVTGFQFKKGFIPHTGGRFPDRKSDGHLHLHVGRSARRKGWQYLASEDFDYDNRVATSLKNRDKHGWRKDYLALDNPALPWDRTNPHSNTGATVNARREKCIEGLGEEYLPANERTAEFEYIFQACRQSYLECHVNISHTEGMLRKMLKRWDLDARKQASALHDRNKLGEEKFKSKQPPLSIETVVSYKLREVAGVLYENLYSMSLYGQDAGSTNLSPHKSSSSKRFFASSKTHSSGRAEKELAFEELCMTESDWHDIYSALWQLVEPAVLDSFQLLLEGSGIHFGLSIDQLRAYGPERECDRHITELREVVNIASVACQLALYSAVEKVRAFDWSTFRKKRTLWQEVVNAEDLDQLITQAEEITYAPMKDFEREIIREILAKHADYSSTMGDKGMKRVRSPSSAKLSKSFLNGERLPASDGDAGGAHGPHSGIALPLMALHLRKDEPMIQTMQDIILDHVERNRTPRSDIIDRAAGAADGCAQQ